MIEAFLLGVIAMASVTAGAFFLKFWRDTRDLLFLAFAVTFLVEGFNRTSVLFLADPGEGTPRIYLVRLFAFLLLLAAILKKNYGSKS